MNYIVKKILLFISITLQFSAPSVVADTAFNIAVNIEYYDLKGMKYSYSESYPVKVLGMFRITKSINDNIYINEIATVTISLRNDGAYPINTIKISDTLPPDFELNNDSLLEWELNLKPGECRSFTYLLKPLQPNEGGYVIPAALATMAKWLYPETFAYLNPEEIHQEYIDTFFGIDFDVSEQGVFEYPQQGS